MDLHLEQPLHGFGRKPLAFGELVFTFFAWRAVRDLGALALAETYQPNLFEFLIHAPDRIFPDAQIPLEVPDRGKHFSRPQTAHRNPQFDLILQLHLHRNLARRIQIKPHSTLHQSGECRDPQRDPFAGRSIALPSFFVSVLYVGQFAMTKHSPIYYSARMARPTADNHCSILVDFHRLPEFFRIPFYSSLCHLQCLSLQRVPYPSVSG